MAPPAKPLLPRLTPPHVLQSGVESPVSLDQILDVPDQLIVFPVRQTGIVECVKILKCNYIVCEDIDIFLETSIKKPFEHF